MRIISATHKKLAALVESGDFRQDLYYRLHVIELAMPPLREMREDIPSIANAILAQARRAAAPARLEPEAVAALERYPFPGNVRELENILERGLSLAADPQRITADDLHLTPRRRRVRVRRAAGREVAAAGLSRPRRARGDQRGAGEDALQPHRGGEAARHHVPGDALPDGAAGHQVARRALSAENSARDSADSSASGRDASPSRTAASTSFITAGRRSVNVGTTMARSDRACLRMARRNGAPRFSACRRRRLRARMRIRARHGARLAVCAHLGAQAYDRTRTKSSGSEFGGIFAQLVAWYATHKARRARRMHVAGAAPIEAGRRCTRGCALPALREDTRLCRTRAIVADRSVRARLIAVRAERREPRVDDAATPGGAAGASPNRDARPPGDAVTLVVVHGISLPPGEFGGDGDRAALHQPARPARASVLRDDRRSCACRRTSSIRRDGELVQFVSLRRPRVARGRVVVEGPRALQRLLDRHRARRHRRRALRGGAVHAARRAGPARCGAAIRSTDVVGHSDVAPGPQDRPGPGVRLGRALAPAARAAAARWPPPAAAGPGPGHAGATGDSPAGAP